MQRAMSAWPRSSASVSTGVPGLIATPARQPSSRIADRVRLACAVASSWKVIESAPAAANASIWSSGASIIRWTSIAPPAACTRSAIDAATSGPIVIGGTKCPSITSTWISRAPAAITSSTWEPSFEKSAERIDGATRGSPSSSVIRSDMIRPPDHTGLSIESPHVWQVMSSVVLIRTIVWCSPQLGHWETSSKRLRQYTQRKRPGSCVGRSQGSPQLGHLARFSTDRFRFRGPSASIIPFQAADEETRRAIAIGAKLEAARIVGRSEAWRKAAEVVDRVLRRLTGRRLRQQRRDPLLALAARDRAGRVDERATPPQRLQCPDQKPVLQLGEALDRPRRLAPAGVRARGQRAEVGAGRVEQHPVEARSHPGGRRVGLDDGDAAQAEPRCLLGLRGVTVVEADAATAGMAPGFDRVLLDPPCSDLGALASRPDARWRKSPRTIERLSELQGRFLVRALEALRPGGTP